MEENDMEVKMLHSGKSYWLDPNGKFIDVDNNSSYHVSWGRNYLTNLGVEFDGYNVYGEMYKRHFIRVHVGSKIHFEYDINFPPSITQLKNLKDMSILSGFNLFDDVNDKSIELNESDYPTQAKDLFKGLWEDILKSHSDYWMDPSGRFFHCKEGHAYWGMTYLIQMGIPFQEHQDETIYDALSERGFIRIKIRDGELYVDYDNGYIPTNKQWRNLKDSAIENHLKLIDGSYGRRREIDLLESINENSNIFITRMKPEQKEEFKSSLAQLFSHLREELKIKIVPKIHLLEDETNSKKLLGRTGYYDPHNQKICLYMTNRHPKDILRSFSHEVIHHWQHENKQLEKSEKKEDVNTDPQYAQNDPWLRQMEKQAYLLGNMMFRDWEDAKKSEGRKKMTEKTILIGKEYPPKKPDYRG
jgi:hypothetical protein